MVLTPLSKHLLVIKHKWTCFLTLPAVRGRCQQPGHKWRMITLTNHWPASTIINHRYDWVHPVVLTMWGNTSITWGWSVPSGCPAKKQVGCYGTCQTCTKPPEFSLLNWSEKLVVIQRLRMMTSKKQWYVERSTCGGNRVQRQCAAIGVCK